MLSHSTLNNQVDTETYAPLESVQQSKRHLTVRSPEETTQPTEISKKKRKTHRVKSKFEALELGPPKIDPRKIMLEMDMVDKSKLEAESAANKTDLAAMKNRDPDELDA